MEVRAVRNAIFKDRNISPTDSSDSKGDLCSPARTTERSKEGMWNGLGVFHLLAPLRKLMIRPCSPTDLPFTGSWCIAIAATYTFKVEGGSLHFNLSCRKENTVLIRKSQVSSQLEGHQSVNRLHFRA